MASKNVKRKEAKDIQYFHIVRELDEESIPPQYVDMVCKVEKDWDFSYNYLYQYFAPEYYSKLQFDEGFEEQAKYVYHKIS